MSYVISMLILLNLNNMNLLKIKQKILKNTQPVWYNAIMEELDIKQFNIVKDNVNPYSGGTIKKIVIDDYQITNIQIDQYSNLYCSINKKMPIYILAKFGRVLTELFYVKNYNGRVNYSLYVKYFERFSKQLTKNDIIEMFSTGTGDKNSKTESFRGWLLGQFEPVPHKWSGHTEKRPWDCNIPMNYHLTYTELAGIWKPGFRHTYWELNHNK